MGKFVVIVTFVIFQSLLVCGYPQGTTSEPLDAPPPEVETLSEEPALSPKQASHLTAPPAGPSPNAHQEEAEADDDSGLKIFGLDRKGTVNTFFPINFNTPPNGRNVRQLEQNDASSAHSGPADTPIAIANSFSTGTKGVANSDAVAGVPPTLKTLDTPPNAALTE